MPAEAPPEEKSAAAPATEPITAASTPQEFHRAIADELFHLVMGMLERDDRTCAENDRMVHAAHASRFHWEFGGTAMNLALGEWQCARVHTVMGQADAALHHAWKYLEYAENYELGPFYVAHAHTALAGAFGPRRPDDAAHHLQRVHEVAAAITEEEEKKLIANELGLVEKEIAGQRPIAQGGCH